MRLSAFPWYGGKYKHLAWLIPRLPSRKDIDTYVEPFGGSGVVLLNLPAYRLRVYNDLDKELGNFFRVLQGKKGDALIEVLGETSYSEDVYVQAIENRTRARTALERARWFYVIARQCRDGMAQKATAASWSDGKESVWANSIKKLSLIRDHLKHVKILSEDAFEVMTKYKFDSEHTLFYCDPPYPLDSRVVKDIYKFETSDKLWIKLAVIADRLKGKVAISSYDCPTIEECFFKQSRLRQQKWYRIYAPYKKGGILKSYRQEILITNYLPTVEKRKIENVYKSEEARRRRVLKLKVKKAFTEGLGWLEKDN